MNRKHLFLIEVYDRIKELIRILDSKYGFDGKQSTLELEDKMAKVLFDNLTEYQKEVETERQLLKDIEEYLRDLFGEGVNERFSQTVFEDVVLTSGYEEEGIYSLDDIEICTKRILIDLIEDEYQ